jgi:hypothetical protein
MPFNFSNITDDLFIGTTPLANDYKALRELGIRLVINMRSSHSPHPDLHKTPFQILWFRTVDSPFSPIPISRLILGAQVALDAIQAGGKVYVHSAYGRHRSVAMGACVLIAQGYAPEAAMNLIAERRQVADPNIYYIRSLIMQFSRESKNMQG